MTTKIEISELKRIAYKSNSPTLEPLKRLFTFADYLDDEYRKTHDGKENPYSINASSAQIEEVE